MGLGQADQAVTPGLLAGIGGIRAGDPVLGPAPADAHAGQGGADGLAADAPGQAVKPWA
jgi:hypothetical protein